MEINHEYFLKLTISLYRVTDCFPKEEPLKTSLREKATQILETLSISNPVVTKSRLKGLRKDIRAIKHLLRLAEPQDWVDEVNLKVLEESYDKVQEELVAAQNSNLNLKELNKEEKETSSKEVSEKEKTKKTTPVRKKQSAADYYEIPDPEITVKEEKEPTKKTPSENQKKSSEKETNKNSDNNLSISGRQKKILRILRNNPRAAITDINEGLNQQVSKRTLRRDLKKLMKKNLIVRKGEGINTFYQIRAVKNS